MQAQPVVCIMLEKMTQMYVAELDCFHELLKFYYIAFCTLNVLVELFKIKLTEKKKNHVLYLI